MFNKMRKMEESMGEMKSHMEKSTDEMKVAIDQILQRLAKT